MDLPWPTGRVSALLTPATRLHVWLKPTAAGQTAKLRLTVGGKTLTLAIATGPVFAFHDLAPGLQGEVILSWNVEDTLLTCLYAYVPDTVTEHGIEILHLDNAARTSAGESLRFRAPMGWMNDPNGFCRVDGRYHLFYQHYPHALRWDAMHWGHACSTDLVHWVHQPVLLIPGQPAEDGVPLGGAFSGSAIAMGQGLRVFFTDHDAARHPKEFQRSALVGDGLHADPATTILPGPPNGLTGVGDFRDPYVFRGPDGGLHMVVGSGDRRGGAVLHYTTDAPDGAAGWVFRGVLHRDDADGTTVAECPCLVPLPGGPEPLWALIYARMEATDPQTGLKNPSRAVVGRFDGTTFSILFSQTLDAASGSYAWQAFDDRGETLAIGWLAAWGDWDRSSDFPTTMTLPRRLLLSPEGTALLTMPIKGLEVLRGAPLATGTLAHGGTLPLPPRAEVLLQVSAPLHLGLSDGSLTIDLLGLTPTLRFADRAPIPMPKARTLRLFFDPNGIEVFADGGRWTASHRLAGQDIARSLTLTAGAIATIWPLRTPNTTAGPRP